MKLLTDIEAAEFLRIQAGTLRNWRVAGKGPAYYKVGGRVRYSEADLREFIEGCRRKGASRL